MKTGIALIFIVALLAGCFGENTDKNLPKPMQNSLVSQLMGMSL